MNNRGFIFVDSLFSLSLVFLLILSTLPLISLINKERHILSERMLIASLLHDELQEVRRNNNLSLPIHYTIFLKQEEIQIIFYEYSYPLIEACASWTNKNNRKDEICFYGSV